MVTINERTHWCPMHNFSWYGSPADSDCARCENERLKARIINFENNSECVHCGAVVPIADEDVNHWRTCPSHPARVEVERLKVLEDGVKHLLGIAGAPSIAALVNEVERLKAENYVITITKQQIKSPSHNDDEYDVAAGGDK